MPPREQALNLRTCRRRDRLGERALSAWPTGWLAFALGWRLGSLVYARSLALANQAGQRGTHALRGSSTTREASPWRRVGPLAMARPPRAAVGLLILALGILSAPLDTAVNIAFPSITEAFALKVEDIRWIVIAYVLTYASLMLVFGRLGDLMGYRALFQLGLLVSAVGLAACAAARSCRVVVLGRILQGVGSALTVRCAPAVAISVYEERDRTRVLG